MLRGKLPDFGYGTNLVITDDRNLWEYILEGIKESPSLELCKNWVVAMNKEKHGSLKEQ